MTWLLSTSALLAAQEVNVDVCVYGGTSGGVIAAVQAARLGKTVARVVVNNHLGGMTSGGLGQTDVGSLGDNYIQGLAREFYIRVGQKYGTGAKFTFEPHVAETVFNEMAQQAGVNVYTNQYLAAVVKQGQQVVVAMMNNSNLFRARMFIDASYEGDLMARAGITYTIGREATNQYGESYNGIRPAANAFGSLRVDPYAVPGNAGSGLLPLLQSGPLGTVGDADHRLQAYNYRLCLTTTATNRLAITAPAGYDPAQYELLGRYLQAMTDAGSNIALTTFMTISAMPNGKTDINNNGAISTDYMGQSVGYPEADHATRQQIELAHQNYIKGLFYFLATDSRVPAAVRSQMRTYGYCKDEFTDTEGWPHQLYAREARRMVSDYVMTQANIMSQVVASDGIGLAVYAADQHSCGRLVINDTVMKLPGAGAVPPQPYPVSYRSLTPRTNECTNLLVLWCLSASHVAFCSLRMEPVFMIAGQSAGTAACFAIDDGTSVQGVNVRKLQAQLAADGQATGAVVDNGGIIVDDADPSGVTIVGDWLLSTSTAGYYGTGYRHDHNANKGSSSVTFVPVLPQAGLYQVCARWSAYSNRSTNTAIDIVSPTGTTTVYVDQTHQGGQWVSLLTTNFNAGSNGRVVIRNGGTTGYVIADAVQFSLTTNLPTLNVWATDANASRFGPHAGSFTVSCSGNLSQFVRAYLNLGGTAVNGADYQSLTTSVTIPEGVASTNLSLVPLTNALLVGDKTVVVTLAANAAYSIGPLASATITLGDLPINNWRLQWFGTNASNGAIAGDNANPSGDGLPNLVKYGLGLEPLHVSARPLLSSWLDASGYFVFSYVRPDPPPVDVSYQVEGSSALWPWITKAFNGTAGIGLNSNSTTATVSLRAAAPAQGQSQEFLGLRVIRR